LSEFGVENPIANPTLQIFNRGGNEVAANDDWRNAPNPTELAQVFTSLGAFQLPPLSTDAAVKVTLPPGAYTAVVTPAADETATGIALLEIYVITEAE
jgi:hypothetical protein